MSWWTYRKKWVAAALLPNVIFAIQAGYFATRSDESVSFSFRVLGLTSVLIGIFQALQAWTAVKYLYLLARTRSVGPLTQRPGWSWWRTLLSISYLLIIGYLGERWLFFSQEYTTAVAIWNIVMTGLGSVVMLSHYGSLVSHRLLRGRDLLWVYGFSALMYLFITITSFYALHTTQEANQLISQAFWPVATAVTSVLLFTRTLRINEKVKSRGMHPKLGTLLLFFIGITPAIVYFIGIWLDIRLGN